MSDAGAQYPPEVAVIIVNWNAGRRTVDCLRQLAQQTHQQLTVFVVDNGSDDQSVELIKREAPTVHVIALPYNLGFAAGVNRALVHALSRNARYVLLLNNDTIIPPDLIERLVAHMEQEPCIGIATPKIYKTGHEKQLWGIGGRMRYAWLTVESMGQSDRGQFDHYDFDFVFGAVMFINRAVFEAIGGLDERYFMYYEDIDFCLRARAAGFRIAVFPDIHVMHEGGASTRAYDHLREYYHIRSRLIFFRRWLRGRRLVWFGLREMLYVQGIVRRNIVAGRFHNIAWYARGFLQGLCWPVSQKA
ncbi:MAG: glycosyltransferase family 2 protein [Roseiflexaceae bacterium]|nr:glycosyltransferase family 2 protein [Roseiflexus sp.]MDW8234253.1 glycosyltransferase family 2 protein [Roseiflexaceae bacterium]